MSKLRLDVIGIFIRVKNYLKGKISRGYKKTKEGLKPKNILEKIKNMPTLDKVYWSKVLTAFVGGIIFGVSNFTAWPAGLTMLSIFFAISTFWFLKYRKIETGIKVRQYYMSAMFQYFLTFVAVWALIWNIVYVPPTDWFFPIKE